jgi:outer membrane lipoprotein carrier protein
VKIMIIIFFSIMNIVNSVMLYALDIDQVIDKTLQKYENMTSFYAEFTQIYCDELSGTCQDYDGKIYFMKPNFFRMEFEDPHQIYVGDSSSLWIYIPDEKRAIRQHIGHVPFAVSPDIFLKDYEENFLAELTNEGENTVEITLTPKEDTDIYNTITVTIHSKKYEIMAIAILDNAGTESKYEFDKIEINKKISKKLFEFNPPEGTSIDEY